MSKRVLVTGTFDLLHEGHIKFLEEASKYGEELHVLLASNLVVQKIKGRLPFQPEQERAVALMGLDFVAGVFVGHDLDGIEDALSLRPDVIVLGYDQYTSHSRQLEEYCKSHSIEFYRLPDKGNGVHTTDLIDRIRVREAR